MAAGWEDGQEPKDGWARREATDRAPLSDERLALVRDRIARGFYRTEWVERQLLLRLLGSADLSDDSAR